MEPKHETVNQPKLASEPAVDDVTHKEPLARAVMQCDGVIIRAVPTMPQLYDLLTVERTPPVASAKVSC
jgi:hypothetical protein